MNWRERRHCPHSFLRPIHGDEIHAAGGRRLQCRDCYKLLDGPVVLAELRWDEVAITRGEMRR